MELTRELFYRSKLRGYPIYLSKRSNKASNTKFNPDDLHLGTHLSLHDILSKVERSHKRFYKIAVYVKTGGINNCIKVLLMTQMRFQMEDVYVKINKRKQSVSVVPSFPWLLTN